LLTCLVWFFRALAGPAAAEVSPVARETSSLQAPLSKASRTYNEKDFVLEVPLGFKEVRSADSVGGFASGGRPKSTYGEARPKYMSHFAQPAH
jgi:hypothetical protein